MEFPVSGGQSYRGTSSPMQLRVDGVGGAGSDFPISLGMSSSLLSGRGGSQYRICVLLCWVCGLRVQLHGGMYRWCAGAGFPFNVLVFRVCGMFGVRGSRFPYLIWVGWCCWYGYLLV